MSSKKYATPLRLEIKPSRILCSLLLILHLFALAIIFILDFEFLINILVAILIAVSAYISIFQTAFRKSSSAIIKLVWDSNNEWILENNRGEQLNAELLRDSYVSSVMTVLNFKCKNHFRHKSIILLKDNINENDFRKLRVRLKVGKPIDLEC